MHSFYIAMKDYNFVKPYWCRSCIKIVSPAQSGPCIIYNGWLSYSWTMVARTWMFWTFSASSSCRLQQIQGLVDRALLRSVRTSQDYYPQSWNGRVTEHTVAAVHTMFIPEQHREPTIRAVKGVEWRIGNTHSSEVNARNSFSAGQVCRLLVGHDYPSLDWVVSSQEYQF